MVNFSAKKLSELKDEDTKTGSLSRVGVIPLRFRLKIVLPNRILYEGDAEYIKLLSPDGELMIYPGHEPYICSIEPSSLEYKPHSAQVQSFNLKRGFCKFQTNLCEIAISDF